MIIRTFTVITSSCIDTGMGTSTIFIETLNNICDKRNSSNKYELIKYSRLTYAKRRRIKVVAITTGTLYASQCISANLIAASIVLFTC